LKVGFLVLCQLSYASPYGADDRIRTCNSRLIDDNLLFCQPTN
jgi:hypothetical protein